MAPWINLNWNNRSVVAHHILHYEKTSCILPLLVGLMAGSRYRQADWLADKKQVDFEIFKILYKL